MRSTTWFGCAIAVAVGGVGARAARADGDGASSEALERHVQFLSDPDLHGRREWDDRAKAATYLKERFQEAGLLPPPGMKDYFVDGGGTDAATRFRDVVAWLPGTRAGKTAADAGEYVLVTAHYDH